MKKIVLYLFVALLAFSPAKSFAEQDDNFNDQPKLKHIVKELNLTDKQKDELSKIRSEYQKKIIDLKADQQKLRIDLKNEIINMNLDESKILSISSKISDLQAKIKESRMKMWLESYKLLDDKQKEIWKNSSPLSADFGHKLKGNLKHFKEHFRNKICR